MIASCAGRANSPSGAFAVLSVAVLLVVGCEQPLKTARPGIDQASGTAQTLQTDLDTIEYHAKALRKGAQ